MKKISSLQWGMLLGLMVASMSITWVFAAPLATPLFTSPIITPGWIYAQTTPTPRPQPVILPNLTPIPATLMTGLRGYWHLNEIDTGNRIDSSPNGNNILTNINGVTWTSNGKIGIASDFESSNSQYLKIESYQAVGLNLDYDFTLVGWIKRESTGSEMILAAKYDYGNNNRAYRFHLTSDDKLRLIVSPDGAYDAAYAVGGGTVLTSTTTWYHVAAVFDTGVRTLKLYLNGNLEAEQTVTYDTVFQADVPFMLGANLDNGQASQFFDGLMDEWRAYRRVLSQSEIQTLMNQ